MQAMVNYFIWQLWAKYLMSHAAKRYRSTDFSLHKIDVNFLLHTRILLMADISIMAQAIPIIILLLSMRVEHS